MITSGSAHGSVTIDQTQQMKPKKKEENDTLGGYGKHIADKHAQGAWERLHLHHRSREELLLRQLHACVQDHVYIRTS